MQPGWQKHNSVSYTHLNYWFETGTPTYLVELLKKHHYDLHRMAHEETSADVLNSIDSTSDYPIPCLLYTSAVRYESGTVLCTSAVSADLETVVDGFRFRPLFPDYEMFPR